MNAFYAFFNCLFTNIALGNVHSYIVTTYVKNQGKEQEYIKFHQGQLALL